MNAFDRSQAQPGRKVTPEQVRAMAAEGYSQAMTAELLGVTRERIRQIANRDGIEFLSGKTDWDFRERVLELHALGLSPTQIARKIGRSQFFCRQAILAAGLKPNRARTKGDDLRDLLAQGMTLTEAARVLGWPVQRAHNEARRLGITDYAGQHRRPQRSDDEYCAAAAEGLSVAETAERLQCHLTAVYAAARRLGIKFRGQR